MAKGDVLVRMKADVGNYNANLAAASRTLKNFRDENLTLGGVVKNMTRSFTGYAAGLMSIGAVAGKLHETVTEAVQLAKSAEGVRIAFNRLNDPSILDGLRQATHGTVTDVELMKSAVKFNDFKLPVEELGTMLAFAQQKAKDTGQSVDYMVDSIVTGLGRKSLMILDNLGLSANEIKEKMKETGDMTKAVGEIIREQMAKAGDYVETAADRAAQANVSLQNKLEELGRKFAPVEEASNQLWTSMKIGILDIIGGPLALLLNGLTEAGRLKNMLNNLNGEPGSGNTKVDQQLKKLQVVKKAGGSDYIFNSTLSGMMEDYNRQIMALDAQIKNGGKKPGAGPGESQDVRYLQRQMDALKIMRDQLAAGARELSKPVDIKIDTKGAEQNVESLKQKIIELKHEEILPAGSVAALNKELQELQKQQTMVTNTVEWNAYNDKIKAVTNQIKELKGELGIEALRGLKGMNISGGILGEETKPLPSKDIIKKGQAAIENFKLPEQPEKQEAKLLEKTQDLIGGLSSIASGLSQMGIELPDGVQKVIGGMQGLMSVIQGVQTILNIFTTTTSSAQIASSAANTSMLAANTAALSALTGAIVTNTATKIIPFFASGGVVKAASGYRVPGHSFSGDNLRMPVVGGGMIGVNSGELILNTSQQGNLASQLLDARMINGGGGGGHDYVSGQNVYLGTNNYLRGSGQGQLVTTRMLRQYGLIN